MERGRRRASARAIPPKIGSNKLSTIFAGLNTLKRLEIRPPGGPFVRRVPGDRHEGLRPVIRAAKREASGGSEMKRALERTLAIILATAGCAVYSRPRGSGGL